MSAHASILASTGIFEIGSTDWHQMEFSVVAGQIKLLIDEVVVIEYIDYEPATPGTPYFMGHNLTGSALLIDNIYLRSTTSPVVANNASLTPRDLDDYEFADNEVIIFSSGTNTINFVDNTGVQSIDVDETLAHANEENPVLYSIVSLDYPNISYDGTKIGFRCAIDRLIDDEYQTDICVGDVALTTAEAGKYQISNVQVVIFTSDVDFFGGWSPTEDKFVFAEYDSAIDATIKIYDFANPDSLYTVDTTPEGGTVKWAPNGKIYYSLSSNYIAGPGENHNNTDASGMASDTGGEGFTDPDNYFYPKYFREQYAGSTNNGTSTPDRTYAVDGIE